MSPATDPASVVESTAVPLVGWARIGWAIDGILIGSIFVFAMWTGLYHLALADVIGSGVAFWVWVVLLAPILLGMRAFVMPWIQQWDQAPWAPQVALGILAAAAAAFIVRPDLDDASYVVRSTWIAEHGDVNFGDVILTDNRLGPLPGQNTYLPSVEALFGWISRTTGLSTAHIVYGIFPPLAAFASVWALGMVFRSWQCRRPIWCLMLAMVFLAWGGADHASWGNLNVARIWQGKVVMLSIVVPLMCAIIGWALRVQCRRNLWVATLAVLLTGVTAVGLSSTAMFVIPGLCILGIIAAVAVGRWKLGLTLFAAGSFYPLLAGVATVLSINLGEAASPSGQDPWQKVLGTGVEKWAVLVALGLAVLAGLWPEKWSSSNAIGRWMGLGSVAVAGLIAFDATYQIAVAILGTDAVAWRLTWIVPVPVMVGLLAALPWRLPLAAAVPAICAIALVTGGVPLWNAANAGAALGKPFGWKMFPNEVKAAQWIAGQQPTGPVLAPTGVGAALEVLTSRYDIVGSRPDYLAAYLAVPDAQIDLRAPLQRLVEGNADQSDIESAAQLLKALNVELACFHDSNTAANQAMGSAGFQTAYDSDGISCLRGP